MNDFRDRMHDSDRLFMRISLANMKQVRAIMDSPFNLGYIERLRVVPQGSHADHFFGEACGQADLKAV